VGVTSAAGDALYLRRRKEACVFRTPMQAQPVIEALAEECKRYGFLLEVDSAGEEVLSAGQTTLPRLLRGSTRKSSL